MNAIIVKGLSFSLVPGLRFDPPPPASQHPSLTSLSALSGSPLPLVRQQHILPSIIEPTSMYDASIAGLISCSMISLFSAFWKQQLISVGNKIFIRLGSLKYSNGMVHSCCRIVGRCPACRTACVSGYLMLASDQSQGHQVTWFSGLFSAK